MTMKTLRTVPFQIDAQAIAQGLLEMFDDNERVALRFGILPKIKMDIVEDSLRQRFLGHANKVDCDHFTAIQELPDKRRIIDFSMRKLVQEAMREVTLAMYDIGDLVV